MPVYRHDGTPKYRKVHNDHEMHARNYPEGAIPNPKAHDRYSLFQGFKMHGRSHTPQAEKKHGNGAHNWGAPDDPSQEVQSSEETRVPAEAHLDPESPEEEKRECEEAGVGPAPPNTFTLEEWEAKGHRV
ncbi:hypothetical protein WJX72_011043 [[Myrmecia] bisecta]|uniref:Hyaluronan/mRNA-binding protein domain-containing protein n=1 Tax=[Myrmecia] bisecta TaxID=41462 RepID=A0AAW1R9B2_9CHLO